MVEVLCCNNAPSSGYAIQIILPLAIALLLRRENSCGLSHPAIVYIYFYSPLTFLCSLRFVPLLHNSYTTFNKIVPKTPRFHSTRLLYDAFTVPAAAVTIIEYNNNKILVIPIVDRLLIFSKLRSNLAALYLSLSHTLSMRFVLALP